MRLRTDGDAQAVEASDERVAAGGVAASHGLAVAADVGGVGALRESHGGDGEEGDKDGLDGEHFCGSLVSERRCCWLVERVEGD